MKQHLKEVIEKCLKEEDNLSKLFVKKYFGKDATEVYWVADMIGGVLLVNDYFFNFDNIKDFLIYGYSKKKMFEYYDYALKMSEKNESPINIKNYKKLKI